MDPIDSRETIRFSESCRLCLRKPGIYNVFKIKGLLVDIYEFTGVKVFLASDLPQTICRECSAVLQNVKELREIATTNDAHMRSLVSDKLEPSKQVEQIFIEEQPLCSINETSNACPVKAENVRIKKSSCSDDSPCISQVAVRSDLFPSAENESPSDTQDASRQVNSDKVKRELDTDNTESMYDFDSSWTTETCSQLFPPELSEDKPKPGGPESSYRCEACAKDFATWKKFYYHNRFHNKTIECIVDGCTKKFATRGDLEKHMRTHTGEKPYQCELCFRRFTQKGTLRVHRVMVHSINKELIIGM